MKPFAAALGLLAITSMASAQTVTQPDTLNTYGTTLNFDEVDNNGDFLVPSGAVAGTEWAGDPWNIPLIEPRGFGLAWVDDFTSGGVADEFGTPGGPGGTIGTGRSYAGGPAGQIITFDAPVESFSVEVWNPGQGFISGFNIAFFLDGEQAAFAQGPFNIRWNDVGNANIDIQADGVVFNQISLFQSGFLPGTDYVYMDNLSWNLVPAPGAFALLGLAGLARRRRREA